jgi:hypothetical protein
MLLEQKPYPFAKGLSAMPAAGRGGWRPRDAWNKTIGADSGGAGAGHWTPPPPSEREDGDNWASRLTHGSGTPGGNGLDALGGSEVPQEVRNIVVAATMRGGEYAREVADRVAQMVDDEIISPAIGAAALRAINLKPAMTGDFQVGVTGPIDSPPDGWGVGGTDSWAGGKRPAMRAIAPPSSNPGFLFDTSAREGKSKRPVDLTKGMNAASRAVSGRSAWTLAELHKICRMIEDWPGDGAPNMQEIYSRVLAERRSGLA